MAGLCLCSFVILENYIVENMKSEMAQIQQNAVQNHTATMLEIGTSLLTQTAEQTRKLTDVETQVLNQTSRLEIQLLENSLSTYKLEKQLLQQTNEILKIHEKNSLLEHKILEMEGKHKEELDTLKEERENLQSLVTRQSHIIQELEKQLIRATSNNSMLQKQQLELMDTVHNLVDLCTKDGVLLKGGKKEEEKPFRDCADVYQAGFNKSGIYTIYINNMPEPKKVFCNMDVNGGGWTVIQHREDGSLDFQRGWKEYKMGFGNPSGEHWLGNEFIFAITSQRQCTLRIELLDWEGNRAYSQYDRFHIGNEKQNYSSRGCCDWWEGRDRMLAALERKCSFLLWWKTPRRFICILQTHGRCRRVIETPARQRLYLKGHSGTAGKQSSLILHGADFSTKDADNDNCMCKCALMLTGGETLQEGRRLPTQSFLAHSVLLGPVSPVSRVVFRFCGSNISPLLEAAVGNKRSHCAALRGQFYGEVLAPKGGSAGEDSLVSASTEAHAPVGFPLQGVEVLQPTSAALRSAPVPEASMRAARQVQVPLTGPPQGGWWFDACGPSNLNGMFYAAGQNHGKLNGIKWHYFKGPSYSLRSTTMMIRPLDF
ncbi:Angiopoietin-1 [Heterocephalus glaber]|uniref:Angiopoietin-1 n=1 Tax=Heterocephalus glaber TaxID=10181 RepID=G5AZ90_HETGA|nr:Angiopoietin-1 [Heterocephalus glaber]